MYEVVKWTADDNEVIGTTKSLARAGLTAQAVSLEDGVSEVLIYNEEGVLVEVWVNGNEVDLDEYIANDLCGYEDDYDEVGYDPYTGCGGWDC